MTDDRIAFLLTIGFFALIVAAVLFLELIAEKSQLTSDRVPSVEEGMQRHRTSAYKAAIILTIGASIASITPILR